MMMHVSGTSSERVRGPRRVQRRQGNSKTYLSKWAATMAGLMLSIAAQAQTAIFQESFASGLGQFTATGTVTTTGGAAALKGCYGCTDGALVSPAISTVGFSSLKLSYDRTTTGLDAGEYGEVAYTVNGTTWTVLESVMNASGHISFNLPAAAANQAALKLRFRLNASLNTELFTIDNVLLEGTGSGGTGSNPYAKGPDPTTAALEAATGPFSYTTATVSAATADGYGGGTIYYPTNAGGTVGAVVVIPGYLAYQSTINWWGPKLASNGFVVMTIDTNSVYDLPPSRATQLMAAVNQLKVFNTTAGSVINGKIDPARMGIIGWSYGGGGTLLAARDNPSLKAAIPMAPKTTSGTNFSGITVPTLIVGCESDTTAPPSSWAIPFYTSIPTTVKKGYLEINNGDHFCPTTGAANTTMIGKYGISWMKRFMDNDTRFSPFLCGSPHDADVANTVVVSGYRQNCPY